MTDPEVARRAERSLVEAFQAGDPGAFDEIVRLQRRRLFVIALRRIGSVEAAEDAVQVALSKAYRHLHGLPVDVDLSAWLASVVSNAAMDQVRGESRQRRLAMRAFEASPDREERRGTERGAGDGPDRLERAELGEILHRAIARLPDPYRRPIELYHLHSLPVEEIGAVLSLNVNTVKSHLARGRGLLRRRLESRLRGGEWL